MSRDPIFKYKELFFVLNLQWKNRVYETLDIFGSGRVPLVRVGGDMYEHEL